MENKTKTEQVVEIIEKLGVVRPRDLTQYNIPSVYLRRLYERGVLEQPAAGLYRLSEAEPSQYHTLAIVSKRVPGGVICLLSALRFHDLTTQSPPDIWMAIESHAKRPVMRDLPVRFLRYPLQSLESGCEIHVIEGVTVKITNPAKTVADCFKYRKKIGNDVAVEALRECLQRRLCSPSEIGRYAKLNRVLTIMRPYLEALA